MKILNILCSMGGVYNASAQSLRRYVTFGNNCSYEDYLISLFAAQFLNHPAMRDLMWTFRYVETRVNGPITVRHVKVPHQENGSDCGLFVIGYCRVLARVPPTDLVPWSMLLNQDALCDARREYSDLLQIVNWTSCIFMSSYIWPSSVCSQFMQSAVVHMHIQPQLYVFIENLSINAFLLNVWSGLLTHDTCTTKIIHCAVHLQYIYPNVVSQTHWLIIWKNWSPVFRHFPSSQSLTVQCRLHGKWNLMLVHLCVLHGTLRRGSVPWSTRKVLQYLCSSFPAPNCCIVQAFLL